MLITFEGIDGSGKSTQARMLVERLEEEGHHTLLVREPGGTDLGERVRELLLDPQLAARPLAELLLFSAARAQLVTERIHPALEAGQIVVCDRFYDSTVAYQGAGRGVGEVGWLDAFNHRVTEGLTPDRTFLFELPLEEAIARRTSRAAADRMEAGGRAFYERVRAGYDELAARHSDRIHRLDGTRSIEVLHAAVWADVAPHLPLPAGTTSQGEGSSEG